MPTPILIITIAGDLHTHAIEWALARQGVESRRWVVTDFPASQTLSWQPAQHNQGSVSMAAQPPLYDDYHSVWLRRFWPSPVPSYVHQADRATAANEIATFRRSLLEVIAPQALWVNPPATMKRAGDKVRQLHLASGIGFKVPATLVTNDVNDLAEFYRQCDGAVIYKPLNPMVWQDEQRKHVTYTTPITPEHWRDEHAIRACPGIFQQNIAKAYEVRATFIGQTCMAVKLATQGIADVEQDWRHGVAQGRSLAASRHELPDSVYQACLQLMQQLGIVYGAFDFIVTADNDYYFLEVNDGGQFLWVEMEEPGCPLIQIFSEFLISGQADYRWSGEIDPQLSWQAYRNSEAYRDYQRDPEQGHQAYRYPTARESAGSA